MIVAFIAIAHISQANGPGHILQFAIAIGGTGEAIERMVRDIKFHDTTAEIAEAIRLGFHFDARGNRRGAGSGCALAAFDFNQTQAA